MAENNVLRSQLAYLNYSDIQARIDEDKLNEYDIVIVKDRRTAAYITPELKIHEFKSRIEIYDSEDTAIASLNISDSVYAGQPVGIKSNGKYILYTVNGTAGDWSVTPAWEHPGGISYNDLVDVPIYNKTGSIGNVIILNELDDAMYSIIGEFKITANDITTYIAGSPEFFIIQENGTKIKRITGTEIFTYDTAGGEVQEDKVATEQYLKDNGYTTDVMVDAMIEEAFEERIEETSSQSIEDLFS